MIGKNNKKILNEKELNKQYSYGIKKLSVGVASVAFAAYFYGGVASANENPEQNEENVATLLTENSNNDDKKKSTANEISTPEDNVNNKTNEELLNVTSETGEGIRSRALPLDMPVEVSTVDELKSAIASNSNISLINSLSIS